MTLYYASTFTDALNKLTHQEQKQVKLTAFDLQLDPKGNGLQMHRIDKSEGFWSVRVNRDLRIILHKDGDTTLLAHVDHHNAAYAWAERKRLIPHERTGAMQFVEVPMVRGDRHEAYFRTGHQSVGLAEAGNTDCDRMVVATGWQSEPAFKDLPFSDLSDDDLLDVGVPRIWLEAVRSTEEDSVDELFELLPAEAAEALLDFATGGILADHVAVKSGPGANPFVHPDAQRRFRVVDNLEELQAALDQPFEKWAVFLHPVQRALVERDWTGPTRVTGSAGTGKTIVALHRAVHIARSNPQAHVLLTTFSEPLAMALSRKRDVLTEAEPKLREGVTVKALDQAAYDLFTSTIGQPNLAEDFLVQGAITEAQEAGLGNSLTSEFLFEEWREVIDAWNVSNADEYAALPRIGRKTRLGSSQREAAWDVFTFVRERLSSRGVVTWAQLYSRLTDWLSEGGSFPFTHVVVDEAQDLSVAQVRFLAEVGKQGPDALFLAGDIGQRIFSLPFSWARLGLDIRGRSHRLKVNYRTSHQIRVAADRLLPPAITDLDGIEEGRRGTVSIFDGPSPELLLADDEIAEETGVADFLKSCVSAGMRPEELAILVRGKRQIDRAQAAAREAGLDPNDQAGVTIAGMHGAKGLEFRAVAVMACDEDVLPDPDRLAGIGDLADLEAAYETERHLLYVACTRARDRLLVSGIVPGSEFLDDLRL